MIRQATETEWIASLALRESVAMNRYEHPDRSPRTVDQERQWWNDQVVASKFRIWSVLVDGHLAGFINAFDFQPDSCETGVQIFETQWRRGIASAAYPLVLTILKTELGFSSTWVGTHPENVPALNLFEKLGYRRDGVMDDPPIQWVKLTYTF